MIQKAQRLLFYPGHSLRRWVATENDILSIVVGIFGWGMAYVALISRIVDEVGLQLEIVSTFCPAIVSNP